MMPMKTTHVVRLALDLDLVIVGLEERGGARPTIAGGALAVAATKVREGRLDVERVRCDQADVRRRTRAGRRGVHKRHLEERAVLSVEAAVACAKEAGKPSAPMPRPSRPKLLVRTGLEVARKSATSR